MRRSRLFSRLFRLFCVQGIRFVRRGQVPALFPEQARLFLLAGYIPLLCFPSLLKEPFRNLYEQPAWEHGFYRLFYARCPRSQY